MASVRIIRPLPPRSGIRKTNTGKWAAIVGGKLISEHSDRARAIQAAGTDKEYQ